MLLAFHNNMIIITVILSKTVIKKYQNYSGK